MREILFRGKRVDNGEWVYGYLYIHEGISEISYWIRNNSVLDKKVIPETVGQYTGLEDKNGKKIFEGDKIKLVYHGEDEDTRPIKIGIMNFNENQWRVNAKHLDGFTMNMYSMEIIGTKFDKEGNDDKIN